MANFALLLSPLIGVFIIQETLLESLQQFDAFMRLYWF